MDRLLARLERRFGRYAVKNLIWYVVGAMALVWVLALMRPEVLGRFLLDMRDVRRGEVWRLATFLFVPRQMDPIWMLMDLYFAWWVGSSLEEHWGAFRFNVYCFVGVVATIVAAVLAGAATNLWLFASLLLAFATVAPDVTILIFFVLPLRVKWLGILTAMTMLVLAIRGDWAVRASILAAVVNYVLFFAGHWAHAGRAGRAGKERQLAQESARRESFRPSPVFGQRVCAICGAREADGADIRVCSCDKCGGKLRALCLEHARDH